MSNWCDANRAPERHSPPKSARAPAAPLRQSANSRICRGSSEQEWKDSRAPRPTYAQAGLCSALNVRNPPCSRRSLVARFPPTFAVRGRDLQRKLNVDTSRSVSVNSQGICLRWVGSNRLAARRRRSGSRLRHRRHKKSSGAPFIAAGYAFSQTICHLLRDTFCRFATTADRRRLNACSG